MWLLSCLNKLIQSRQLLLGCLRSSNDFSQVMNLSRCKHSLTGVGVSQVSLAVKSHTRAWEALGMLRDDNPSLGVPSHLLCHLESFLHPCDQLAAGNTRVSSSGMGFCTKPGIKCWVQLVQVLPSGVL